MSARRKSIVAILLLAMVIGGVSTVSAQADGSTNDDGNTTFTVGVENVAPTDVYPSDSSTGGQVWVTPGAYAAHTGSNPVFTEGESASIGLEAQAEAGPPTGFSGQPGLVDELSSAGNVATAGAFTPANTVADPNDPMGSVPGAPPIAPGGAFEFEVEASPGQNLSFATMFVPSNDLFFAPESDGIALYENGQPVSGNVTDDVELWDAGTETNQEPGFGPDQAPAQSSPNQGGDEGGVVRPISQVNDGYSYPAVEDAIRVTVTPQNGDILSDQNPFADSNGNPVDRPTVISRVVDWNNNGEIDGTSFTRQEIVNFVVEWNNATS